MNSCRITINNGDVFQVEMQGDKLVVNGKPVFPDIVPVGEGCFHMLLGTRSFNIEIVRIESKQGRLKINGKLYDFTVGDRFDELLERMGMAGIAVQQVNDLKAPMPGLVLKTLVATGQAVGKGDQLLVLEAMKMENIIKS